MGNWKFQSKTYGRKLTSKTENASLERYESNMIFKTI